MTPFIQLINQVTRWVGKQSFLFPDRRKQTRGCARLHGAASHIWHYHYCHHPESLLPRKTLNVEGHHLFPKRVGCKLSPQDYIHLEIQVDILRMYYVCIMYGHVYPMFF